VFAVKCGICHREGGAGTFMLSRRLTPDKSPLLEKRTDLQAVYISTVVRRGLASMPWFTRVEVTDRELQAISAYLVKAKLSP
jgi:mono/diheme cytochrome c family protein